MGKLPPPINNAITYKKLLFMTLIELRYIVTLADELHIGRTAALCHVSQPALSIALRKLEEELGLVLFERGNRYIRVSEAARPSLLRRAKCCSR